MLPLEKQRQLTERFLVIEDPQERMALVVDHFRRVPPLAPELKTEAALVKGCSSRVWIVPEVAEWRCRFQLDADSGLVKGLAGLMCAIYEEATPTEVAAVEPTLLETLHLTDHLSATRRHGLAQIRRVIREFAERVVAEAGDTGRFGA